MPGQQHDKDTHYYPVMSRPHNYSVTQCCHADISVHDLVLYRKRLSWKYNQNIKHLLESESEKQFRERQLELGLCKQTLFSGLPVLVLAVPSIFTMDIMHLSALNDPNLFMKLFTGKLDVYEPDDRDTWDWAIFYKDNRLWNAHGSTVPISVPFIPSSFGHLPCDPAKKMNSGYKA